jgi:hypothetical protein
VNGPSYPRSPPRPAIPIQIPNRAAADLVWRLRQVGSTRASLTLEVGSNHYLDTVTAPAGTAEVYGMLTLRIATF